jgi:trimethylamine--corrinoid protein Co-methyltransferase
MPLEGHIFRNPKGPLSKGDLDLIHDGTMRILSRVGLVFSSEEALDILQRGGCQVDRASGRVRFPRALVNECIEQCPSCFTIRARSRDHDLEIGGNRLYFQSHPGLYLLDLESNARREATLEDIGPLVRLVDAMDEIHLSIMPTSTISDRPPPVMIEWVTAEQMRNTQKVTAAGVFEGCAPWVIEMARVTGQQVYGQINSVSPLTFPQDQIEGALAYVQAGHPVCILPGPTLGANSPATLAGALVLQNAEHLAAVVLFQLYRPGAPVTLASYPHLMDVRDAALCIGAVEIGLLGAALAQMARRYAIPSHPEFPITDSKCLDEQSALEKAMTVVLLAEAGAHLISNGGALQTEKLWSPIQLVIDNEINGMVGRILQGIAVTEATLALDVIEEIGHAGNYLESMHTLRHWREEQFLPHLADRQAYEPWVANGAKDMVDRAKGRALELLQTHQVPPLPEAQDRELVRILRAAEAEKLGS